MLPCLRGAAAAPAAQSQHACSEAPGIVCVIVLGVQVVVGAGLRAFLLRVSLVLHELRSLADTIQLI